MLGPTSLRSDSDSLSLFSKFCSTPVAGGQASDPSGGGTLVPWGLVWTPDVQVGSQVPQGVSRQQREGAPPEGLRERGGCRDRGHRLGVGGEGRTTWGVSAHMRPFCALGKELET